MLASIFFVVLLLPGPCRAFDAGFLEVASAPQKDKDKDKDTTHYGITVCALCRVTIDYLKSAYKMDVGLLEKKFNVTNGQCPQSSVRDIITALRNSGSRDINPWQFATMVKSIASANTKTDLKEMLKAESHFDSEKFHGSSQLVLKRYEAALNSILTADNYDQARKAFGEMLHTLQVSHRCVTMAFIHTAYLCRISTVIRISLNLASLSRATFSVNGSSETMNTRQSV